MLSKEIRDSLIGKIQTGMNKLMFDAGILKVFDTNRVSIWADKDKYKKKEDAFVWAQDKKKIPDQISISIDGIHVCNFETSDSEDVAMSKIWKGVLEAYSRDFNDNQKMFLDTETYKKRDQQKIIQKEAKKQEKLKRIKKIKATTPEEKEAKSIATTLIKDE